MVRELSLVKIPKEWRSILKQIAAIEEFKLGGGGESVGEQIIAPALCNYHPLIALIKKHNLKMPECEEK